MTWIRTHTGEMINSKNIRAIVPNVGMWVIQTGNSVHQSVPTYISKEKKFFPTNLIRAISSAKRNDIVDADGVQ